MNNLDTVQLEQLKAIGTYLSQVRQQQARSLEDVAAKTYIPLRLLRAIEAGQEKVLPEPVFVQGFIRRYADALGLDGKDLAQQFPLHAPPVYEEPKAEDLSAASPRTLLQPVVLEESKLSSRAPVRSVQRSYAIYIAIAALAIAGLGYGLFKPKIQEQSVTESAQIGSTQAKPFPAATSKPKPLSSAAAKPSPKASSAAAPLTASEPSASTSPTPNSSAGNSASPSAPVTVAVNLTDRSWLQVSIDGEVEFEGILPKGTQRSWAGKQKITVVSGNAGAVLVKGGQGKAEAMGKPGQVEEKTFTAKE